MNNTGPASEGIQRSDSASPVALIVQKTGIITAAGNGAPVAGRSAEILKRPAAARTVTAATIDTNRMYDDGVRDR